MAKKIHTFFIAFFLFLCCSLFLSTSVQAEVITKYQGNTGAALVGSTPIYGGRGFLSPDGSDGAYLVWPDSQTGTAGIYAQRLNSNGVKQWTSSGVQLKIDTGSDAYTVYDLETVNGVAYACTTRVVNSGASRFVQLLQLNPSTGAIDGQIEFSLANSLDSCYLKAASDGQIFMSWSVNDGAGEEVLYLQKINSTFTIQFSPVITVRSEDLADYYSLARLDNDLAVVWAEKVGTALSIKAQLYNNSGTAQWTAGGVTVASIGNEVLNVFGLANVGLTSAASETYLAVAWEGYDGTQSEAEAQLLDADGNVLWGSNGVSVDQWPSIVSPLSVVFNSEGNVFLAWDRGSGAQSTRWTMAQTVDTAGTKLLNSGQPLRVSSTDLDSQTYQEGVVSFNDRTYVMYYHDGDVMDIFATVLDNDGTIIVPKITLVDAPFNQYSTNPYPDFANFILSGSRIFHFWSDFRDNDNDDIFYNVYAPAYQISNLASGLDVTVSSTSVKSSSTNGATGNQTALIVDDATDKPIGAATVDFSEDWSWSTVAAEVDTSAGKAYVHNLASAAGVSGTITLYVPKLSGHTAVYICPNATTLAAVTNSCTGGYSLTSSDSNVSTTTVSSQDYWVISGLSGTGGISLATVPASPSPSPSASTQPTVNPNFNQLFTASDGLVCRDQVITLEWRSKGMYVVTLNGEKVSAEASRQVTVKERTEYLLKGVGAEGTIESRITIEIDPDQSTCQTSQPTSPVMVKTTTYNAAGNIVRTSTAPLASLEKMEQEQLVTSASTSPSAYVRKTTAQQKVNSPLQKNSSSFWQKRSSHIFGGILLLLLALLFLFLLWRKRRKKV